MQSLGSEAQSVASSAVGALAGMAEAAGHPALTEALAGMGSTGVTMFAIAGAAFEQSAGNHAQTAQAYQDSEDKNVKAVRRIGAGDGR
jgi:hypothetical protein